MIGDFHFLRPWWLLALIPCALLAWGVFRRGDGSRNWQGIIAPHLLPELIQGSTRTFRFRPQHLIAIGWLLAIIAIAGPTWRREPAPFADDTAALAIVIKVTPSMATEDIPPSRLERSVQKIHDLLQQRRGAKTALIAYAGTAHVVMPATTDEGIISTFAQALSPEMMPEDGDAAADAVRLADRALADAGSGSILWITDSISPEQVPALETWRKKSVSTVRLLAPLLSGEELDTLNQRADAVHAKSVPLAADDADVQALAHAAKFATVTGGGQGARWEEGGWLLTPVLAALLLFFFRRGWMPPTASRA